MLQRCKQLHGRCTPDVFGSDAEFCSVATVSKRFGSWSEAKEQAGIDEDLSSSGGRQKQYSDSQILSHLKELRRREGTVTTNTLSKHDDLVSPSVVVERFDSWLAAKEEAGIDIDERNYNSRPREYTDAEYLDLLRECQERHGKVTQRIFNDDDTLPSAGAIRKRFGSWNEAKQLSGIDTAGSGNRRYSKQELLEMLRSCAQRHDGDCSASQFAADDDTCAPETLQRRFGSWNNAKKRAGL
jgi:transposase